MLYLADFKRKYEKWLNEQPENKKIIIPTLNTKNKERTVAEIKRIIANTRQTNLKKGRNKKTKTYKDTKNRLKTYTGKTLDFVESEEVIKRKNKLKREIERNYKNNQRKNTIPSEEIKIISSDKKNIVTSNISKKPIEQVIKKSPKIITDTKVTQTGDATQNILNKKKYNKLALGAIATGIVIGTGYGIYKKTRKDKGIKRGKYKK